MNIGNIGPHLLQDKRHRQLGWPMALAELIDNSFDAAASRVEIDFRKNRELLVWDDGDGCPNIERMLTIADHMPSKTTKLGRYGVGLKDAACWMWGTTEVRTVHKGKAISAKVNWDWLSKQDTWDVPDPSPFDPPPAFSTGTAIRFSKIARNKPSDMQKLIAEIGYTFWPALSSGRQVVFKYGRNKKEVCVPWTMPPLTDIVEDAFFVDGKHVAIRVGIVAPDDTNQRSGFNFAHEHRNIKNSALGSNGLSVSRICGVVQLGPQWNLSTNKSEICDEEDQQALSACLWERCRHIIEKSQSQAESIYNRELESSVSDRLRGFLSTPTRERRDAGNTTGAVEPKDTGRRRSNAAKTTANPGSITDKINVGNIRMEMRERSDGRLGEVDLPGSVVYLNPLHDRIKYHRDNKNNEAMVDACLTLLTIEVFDRQERDKFPFARQHECVVDALSALSKGQLPAKAMASA